MYSILVEKFMSNEKIFDEADSFKQRTLCPRNHGG
jgi:hypothetical protein